MEWKEVFGLKACGKVRVENVEARRDYKEKTHSDKSGVGAP
jgi:hypothetical protein